tara:strand:+ start:160 stop:729 length:570 start_codon:yes stop_codon:yes gene_type:complete
MSTLKVDTILKRSGTGTITIGQSGDTVTLGSGASQSGFGLSNWSESSGNLLPSNASYGVYLGVNSATAANLLNDYEFGTFTPTIAPTSGSFTSVGTHYGYYTKIGNLVHYQCQLEVTNVGSASANINVNNMPFTSASTGVVHTVNHGRETNINGSTFVTIMSRDVTQIVMLAPPFGTNANYSLNGTYRV